MRFQFDCFILIHWFFPIFWIFHGINIIIIFRCIILFARLLPIIRLTIQFLISFHLLNPQSIIFQTLHHYILNPFSKQRKNLLFQYFDFWTTSLIILRVKKHHFTIILVVIFFHLLFIPRVIILFKEIILYLFCSLFFEVDDFVVLITKITRFQLFLKKWHVHRFFISC